MIRKISSIIPYLVLALMLVVQVSDPQPLQRLRGLVFDTYQRAEPRTFDPRLPVKIVDIDDASLAKLGQWPWPRPVLADMVTRLAQSGAAAIAFDIVFAERDRTSPEQIPAAVAGHAGSRGDAGQHRDLARARRAFRERAPAGARRHRLHPEKGRQGPKPGGQDLVRHRR